MHRTDRLYAIAEELPAAGSRGRTASEATPVALALATLPVLPFAPDGRSALTKILAAMTAEERARATALGRRLWIRDRRTPTRPAVANVLDEAVRTGVVTVLAYVDKLGSTTRRRPVEPMALARPVEPMALAATDGHWYLLAWCRQRRAGRWFWLDRIESAHLTTELAPQRDLIETFGRPPVDAGPIILTD